MSSPNFARYLKQEMKYRIRGEVASEIRKSCHKGDPMVTCITVMLGTIIAIAALDKILNRNDEGRTR